MSKITEKISTFAERLQYGRTYRGITSSELSRLSGVSKSSLTHYMKGDWEGKQDSVYNLARALNVSEPWLMGYDVPMEREAQKQPLPDNITPMPHFVKKPRLGAIACGEPILADDNIECYDDVPEHIDCDFTLVCCGDSMINARIFDGDIVYIRQQDEVENGEIAAVRIDDEATLKRVQLFDDHIVLMPENPLYKPLVYWNEDMNNVHIIGKAVHFLSRVR